MCTCNSKYYLVPLAPIVYYGQSLKLATCLCVQSSTNRSPNTYAEFFEGVLCSHLEMLSEVAQLVITWVLHMRILSGCAVVGLLYSMKAFSNITGC